MTGPLHMLWRALYSKTHVIPLVLLVIGIALDAMATVGISLVVLLLSTVGRFRAARKAEAAAEAFE